MAAKILMFGSTGQLALELKRACRANGTDMVSLSRAAADFSKPDLLGAIVAAHRPDIVVIAAAYTAVDKAESDEPLAMLINAEAPGVIAAAAAALDIPVLHLSTDYVFDGSKESPYVETDLTRPINAYGRSKLAGESRVREANPRHLILRTSWLYSAHDRNFVRTMLHLAEARNEVRIVADQQGCPTSADDLAEAIAQLAPLMMTRAGPAGTYHLAGATATTWHGLAEAVFAALAARGLRRPQNIAISTSAYPTPAQRPLNSRLASDRFRADFGFDLPGFEASLPRVLDAMLASPDRSHEGKS